MGKRCRQPRPRTSVENIIESHAVSVIRANLKRRLDTNLPLVGNEKDVNGTHRDPKTGAAFGRGGRSVDHG